MELQSREQQQHTPERAVLVKVITDGSPLFGDPLAELAELVRSAGGESVSRVVQKRRSYDSATCVGKGKVDEIRQKADAYEATVVIFDNDLSPSQIREIERIVERKVIDRSELILDIFAARARTHEARLQVELAQLEYTAPRLRGMWTHLERIAGAGGGTGAGSVGGIGTRGPGERQIEIDRRLVGKRVAFLKQQLSVIERRRQREVKARKDHFTVSLVGYTNAGKSTLMNTLTDARTLSEDKLFATLDTLTRRWELGGGRHVLLSDTVGFIQNLPHHLVASFRATLEEAIHADLLLHVVDASNPECQEQIEAVNEVLEELGAGENRCRLVLNKVDVAADEAVITVLRNTFPDSVAISARTGKGLDDLGEMVLEIMRGDRSDMTLSISSGDGKALSFVERHAEVLDQRFEEDRTIIELRISNHALEHLHTIARDVRHVENGQEA